MKLFDDNRSTAFMYNLRLTALPVIGVFSLAILSQLIFSTPMYSLPLIGMMIIIVAAFAKGVWGRLAVIVIPFIF
ncbi:MAG TPA: hypothetical protein P5116_01500 [Eubacteriales bacterium]|nr:hypothetical protein [Eubacteriales bacterium]